MSGNLPPNQCQARLTWVLVGRYIDGCCRASGLILILRFFTVLSSAIHLLIWATPQFRVVMLGYKVLRASRLSATSLFSYSSVCCIQLFSRRLCRDFAVLHILVCASSSPRKALARLSNLPVPTCRIHCGHLFAILSIASLVSVEELVR